MPKILKSFAFSILSTFTVFAGASCNAKQVSTKMFGDFSYNGNYLIEHATKTLSLDGIKSLVSSNSLSKKTKLFVQKESPLYSYSEDEINETIRGYLTSYGNLNIEVSYYVSDSEDKQTRSDIYQGTDFLALLKSNRYEPFGQMVVDHLYITDELLDEMEEKNKAFKSDSSNIISPFNEPYTYHCDDENAPIVQTHAFAEIPSSINGGIGSTFREDCEAVYDHEGKITSWQSSLGIYTSTPTGTVKTGYIFEASFTWNGKINEVNLVTSTQSSSTENE